ncbi:MAG: NAD(P)H-dependent oxidoreductase subunit E, partial [Thermovirga sp.]|nr:NAD(P)H-dependent oxidoreductase subunit E [Thermovirga sp.]
MVAVQAADVEEKVKKIIEPWKGVKGGLIPILQNTQHEFGYLREDAMEIISREL